MKLLHRECVLQTAHWIFTDLSAFWAISHTTSKEGDTDFLITVPSSPVLPDCLHTTFSFVFEKLNGLILSRHHPTVPIHIVSKICPASSLPVVVLTKQHKEAVYCYVYFPSLRCGFLTTMLSLFWKSSASKTWSNLLHPEAIEQNRVMAAITYSQAKTCRWAVIIKGSAIW